jgi:murein DD-endopeptidase MepM/ murein hydrolase activator NlpD
VIEERLKQLELKMGEITNRDKTVYRSIFEADPIADSARIKDMEQKKEVQLVQRMGSTDLVHTVIDQLNSLALRMEYQNKSFNELIGMVKNKAKLLAAIPAIQPIANKDLKRIASGFGYRVHPIYKTYKFHSGIDFTAPRRTPVYATGNGTVEIAKYEGRGYGNHIIINHGFGYESLYGHLSSIEVSERQKIKRGELIGYVGSTGTSTAPHLHYEVAKNNKKVNPINYFFNDVTEDDYNAIRDIASRQTQSFD